MRRRKMKQSSQREQEMLWQVEENQNQRAFLRNMQLETSAPTPPAHNQALRKTQTS